MADGRTAARLRGAAGAMLALALLAPAAASAQETQDTTRLPAAVRTARATFQAAYRGLDPVAAAGTFADSAVVDFQGQLFSGRVAIVESFLPTSVQGLASIRFGPSSFTITDREVVENGSYFIVPEGGPEQGGSFRTTWRRMGDGAWKIVKLDVFATG